MKAIQFSRFGAPDVLQVVELPKPVPQAGEVVVAVRAAGVNFFEVLMRANRYAVTPELPMRPGVEVAGVVEAVGSGVSSLIPGDRVAIPLFATSRPFGGYAEFVCAPAASVVAIPAALSFEDATALLVQGLTALHLAKHSPPRGKRVMITAAAGGVGSLAIQLVKAAGAKEVIALASTRDKLDLARQLGADVAVDYNAYNWTQGVSADAIYDLVGGLLTRSCLEVLAPGGELLFGAMGRFELTSADVAVMMERNQALRGFSLLPLLQPDEMKAGLLHLFNCACLGELKVIVGGRYPLERAAEAHRALETRATRGKVVLIV